MILLENIFYLFLIIVVVFLYGYIIKVIFLYIKQIFKEKNYIPKNEIFNIVPNTPIKKILLIVFILSNISMQMSIRDKWVNKDTYYHDAKEYFITNSSIVFYKKVLHTLFKVDNPIFIPFDTLRDHIYEKGIKHIPNTDGEIGYWYYRFYGYFYSRKGGYMPNQSYSNVKTPPRKDHKQILDDIYNALKDFATKPIKDKKVLQEKYKVFTLMGDFFMNKRFLYFGNYRGYDRRLDSYEDKAFLKKMNNLLSWTLALEEEYKTNGYLKEFIEEKRPIISITYFHIVIELSKSFLHEKYIQKEFDCNDPMVDIFLEYREKLVDKDSPLYRLSKSQQDIVIDFTFNETIAQSLVHYIDKQCGKKATVYYPSKEWIDKKFNMGDKK